MNAISNTIEPLVTKDGIPVLLGQLWQDCDARMGNRRRYICEIDYEKQKVRMGVRPDDPRGAWISVRRMYPHSSGWKLVGPVNPGLNLDMELVQANRQLEREVARLRQKIAQLEERLAKAASAADLPKALWYKSSGYGYAGRVPCTLLKTSQSGKRAYVKIETPSGGEYRIYVSPEKLEPRQPNEKPVLETGQGAFL